MSYYSLISLMPKTPAVDPDAQAFITAASITNPTQQSAINQLVVDLKGYGVWSKMKALYPFVGGTAAQHKWNLKDPRDLDAAFRLVFSGGWTHSANGATPNGTNAYADTFFNQTTNFTSTSNASIGVYLRTNNASTGADMGAGDTGSARQGMLIFSSFGGTYYGCAMGDTFIGPAPTNNDSRGFYSVVRNAGVQSLHKRGNITLNVSETEAVGSVTNETIWVGGGTSGGYNFSSRETAFNFIGDSLSQTEIDNYYTAVQAFQTTLGRSIGTQTVSDADAQAFVTNAGIVDQVEANAVNNLVIGLKADGLWSKMKAVYPFVGGTSTTTSYNLRNTAQYQITWNGGITFSSTGVLPNGTNGYGQTGFSFNSTTALSSHISTYIRTNSTSFACEMGSGNASTGDDECRIVRNGAAWSNNQCDNVGGRLSPSAVNSTGLILNSRRANNDWETYQNGISLATKTTTNSYTGGSNYSIALFARNSVGSYDIYSNKQCAFASIGDGLTDTEVTNLNTRVTTFQTALNRNV